MDLCIGGSISATDDLFAGSVWGDFLDVSTRKLAGRKPRVLRRDSSALPGVAITSEIVADEGDRRALLAILSRFASEGYVSRTAMCSAQVFINALPRGRALPKIAPDGDGGVVLAWEVPNRGRTLMTVSDWVAYAVSDAGTKDAKYLEEMPVDGIIPDSLLAVIPA